ncbi:MAG: hypothetical protein WA133_03725 [Syntrophales bacterium]
MKNRERTCLAFLEVAIVFAALSLIPSLLSAATDSTVDCQIDSGACSRSLGKTGITATLDIFPKPVVAMQKLSFRLDLEKGPAPLTDGEVSLSLAMPGMYMAENVVKLNHKGRGRYEGEGVLVKCPSGNKVWRVEARIRERSVSGGYLQRASYTIRLK